MKTDYHIHTEFSCDSEAKMEQYVKQALEREIRILCFTDHVDLNPDDYGYNYYNPVQYFEVFRKVKEKYGEQLAICSGIEFGEPHLYADALKRLSEYPYDFIIGSIHWIGNMFPCQKVREQYSAKDFYTLYWKEVRNTVKQGGFDALGHIDFPKRYYGEIYYVESELREIFKRLLDKDRIIEINTSSLRKGHSETMPGKDLLQIYADCGGRYVTIGSDAHVEQDVGADYETAKMLAEGLGLRQVVYRERKRVEVEW